MTWIALSAVLCACAGGPPEPVSAGTVVAPLPAPSPVPAAGVNALHPDMAKGRALLAQSPPALAEAAAHYQASCDGGHMPACSALGNLAHDGRGVPHDLDRAKALHWQACEGGAGIGCFNLGLMAASGVSGPGQPSVARTLFLQADGLYAIACEGGELGWCMNRGVLYEDGFGVPQDLAKAREIYGDSCARGHAESCVNLALMDYYGKGVPADKVGPKVALAPHCSDETPLACGVLGQMYLIDGDVAALPLLEQACDQGERAACGMLGSAYGMGDIVPMDLERSSQLEERACLLGSAEACQIEAMGSQTPERAYAFYERACRIGSAPSCAQVAAHLERGLGVAADPARAMVAATAACRMGDYPACLSLIVQGVALPLDARAADQVLRAACADGIPQACP